jgi:hypothetical protein
MNYSFFLFTKLYDIIIGEQYEYDSMFDDLKGLYREYDASEFNDSTIDEYQCMTNFLTNKKTKQ